MGRAQKGSSGYAEDMEHRTYPQLIDSSHKKKRMR